MSIAPSALVQLDSACELFSKSAHGFGAQKVLVSYLVFLNIQIGLLICLNQTIMLRLQEKAHVSLSEYRKAISTVGRHGSDPPTPIAEDDELATLGGKTRLVAKKEPTSPAMITVSPNTFNPVVPLPLSPTNSHVHPNVVEYLRTFAPTPAPQQQPPPQTSPPQQFIDNTNLFGMPAMPGSYNQDPNAYLRQQQHQQMQTHQQPTLSMDTGSGSFPQYFPVYDYGVSADSNMYPLMQLDTSQQMVSQASGPNSSRNSLTPEHNMHTTWNDFVSGLGMQA